MSRTILAIGLLALAFSVSPAQAGWFDEGIGAYNRPGPYLSLGAGAVLEDFDLGSGPGFDFDTEPGWEIGPVVGYRLAPWAAVELEGKYFDGMTLEFDSPLGNADVDLSGWSMLANGKIYAPWNHRIQPWVKGGVGFAELEASSGGVSADDGDFAWQAGVGVDLVANDRFVVGVQGTRFQSEGDLDGFDFWTAGGFITIRFGGVGGSDYAAQ